MKLCGKDERSVYMTRFSNILKYICTHIAYFRLSDSHQNQSQRQYLKEKDNGTRYWIYLQKENTAHGIKAYRHKFYQTNLIFLSNRAPVDASCCPRLLKILNKSQDLIFRFLSQKKLWFHFCIVSAVSVPTIQSNTFWSKTIQSESRVRELSSILLETQHNLT